MKTELIQLDQYDIDEYLILKAANLIKEGRLVAFPTETVYGLGANGLDQNAVEKIFKAKGRPSDNPLILHISNMNQLKDLVKEIPDIAYKCMDKFWPGPLTIIFKKKDIVPDIITGGLDTVAIRMPDNPIAKRLIELSNTPIAAPSANISGRPSPTKLNHVVEDLMNRVDMIIDGGDTGLGLESTVLDLSNDNPMILRPGGITYEDLKEIIPNITMDNGVIYEEDNKTPRSPGQKYKHYAPRGEMILFQGEMENIVREIIIMRNKLEKEGKTVGIMATEETKDYYENGLVIIVGSRKDKSTIASNLFSVIRKFDESKVDVILAEAIELDNMGMAIMNRMIKAAGGRIIKVER